MEKIRQNLRYTDIYSLELYQCILMIFVNPIQLIEAAHSLHESPYIYGCAALNLLLGIFSVYSLCSDSISIKRISFQLHWILCLIIVSLIIKDISYSPYTIITFYSSQLVCSMYCYWRISIECFVRGEE